MPKMNGKKIPYPDAEKRTGRGSLSYGKTRMGGGGVAEDVAAAAIGGAAFGGAGVGPAAAAGAAGAKIKGGSTRGPNPSELDGREKEEQEEYLRRLEKAAATGAAAGAVFGGAGVGALTGGAAASAVKPKEKRGMGGSIARGSGAARAQQFRKNG